MQPYSIIAIVDDDVDDLTFIQDALEEATQQFTILPFQSSVAFIEYIEAAVALPVLVVLDYNMPKMNAEEILVEMNLSEHLATVKTFILSTGMNPVLKERLLLLGASCCISKPTSFQEYKLLANDIINLAASIQTGFQV